MADCPRLTLLDRFAPRIAGSLLVLAAFAFHGFARAQEPQAAEVVQQGKYTLHKFQQAIGEEAWTLSRDGDGLVLQSKFKFIDRGSPVQLAATLKTAADLTPKSFAVKGHVSRVSTIDTELTVDGPTASVREGKQTRQMPVPARCFAISGYAPVAVQMLLVRYLKDHKGEGALPTLPGGAVRIEWRGREDVQVGDQKLELDHYSVSGLIWGQEALWLDRQQDLVAMVGVDAEFDHFEAVRPDCESALGTFVQRAATDGMSALADLASKLSPARAGALAIVHARLIDGTGKPPVAGATIVVEGGRITAAGPADQVAIPEGATLLDVHGNAVLPGLFDMHAHFEQVEWGPVYLAAGVTTVRDCGNEFDFVTAVRDAIAGGRGLGPRLLLAGIVDGNSRMALGVVRAGNAEEAQAVVARYHAAGFQQIKIYSSVKREVVAALATAAHAAGMTVTGHIPSGMNAMEGIEAGMDQINHIQYLPDVMRAKIEHPEPGAPAPPFDPECAEAKAALKSLLAHGTVIDPTLVVFEWMMHSNDVPFASIEPGAAKVPHELFDALNNTGLPPAFALRKKPQFDSYLAIVGALHRAGVPIVAGTDQVVPGHSLHRELELYVQAGFTPLEAIQSATLVPARVMHLEQDLGTVAPGKIADLIVVDGDPLAHFEDLRKVRLCIANGRVFECSRLWESVGFKP